MVSNLRNKNYIKVLINGELYLLNYEVVLDSYLLFIDVNKTDTAAKIFELNNKIISKDSLGKFKLSNFTKLELVQVVGGG
jgi:thiamine biosynthesis protein ThiS